MIHKQRLNNRILSLALAFVMVLSLLPMASLTAFAADAHTHPICGAAHTDVGDHTENCADIAWAKWNSSNAMPTEAGSYYLADNVTLSGTWEIPAGVEISLCLNGYSISGNNAVRVISIAKTATLNLCDCSSSQAGKITEGNAQNLSGGGVYVPTNSTFNLYGGSITNNKASYQGGGIFIFGGTFHMYGGTISNNSANIAAGVFNVNNGTAYMYAGTISENVSIDRCGGIFTSGFFHMQGGIISENNSGKNYGDGVYVNGGSFVMSGGEISDNAPESDKSIYVEAISKFMISGKPVIKDAIYLYSNDYGTAYIAVCGALDDEVKIPATNRSVGELLAKGTDTYSLAETDIAKFTSTNGQIILDSTNNRLVICDDSHPDYEDGACKTCDAECVHSFVYEANENVITENCNADSNCGHNATATLIVDSNASTIYSGNEIKPLKVEYLDDWFGGDLAVSYTNNTNVGTNASASGSITINGMTYTATKTFEITAADISSATVTLNPESGSYTGSAYTPDVTVTLTGFGTLAANTDFTVSWDKDGFTNAGTYTATIEGKGNFAGKVTKAFTVNAATLTDIKVEQVGTLTYNGGNELTPTVSASAVAVNHQPVSFTYSIEKDGTYGAMPTFTNAGTYTVYYKVSAYNHSDASGNFTVKVYKATVTEPTIASKVYNGSAQTANITDTDLYTVTQNNGGTVVGEYYVVLTLKDSANYKWKTTENAAVTLTFEITKATNEWKIEPTISGWTYGNTASTPNYSAKFGTVSIQYSGTANDDTVWNSETAPTKAGNYTALFTVTDNENYTELTKDVPFTIAKADQTTLTITGKPTGDIAYGDSFTLATEGGSGDGIVSYVITEDSQYVKVDEFEGKVEITGVGTVKITATKAESANYKAATATYEFTTVKATPDLGEVKASEEIKDTTKPADVVLTRTNSTVPGTLEITDSAMLANKSEYNWKFTPDDTANYNTVTGKVQIDVLDTTAPAVVIKVDTNEWKEILNNITFGLFFKDAQDVTIIYADNENGSGIKDMLYYVADRELTDEELAAVEWETYNGTFNIDPDRKYVIYAKATDNDGNTVVINSDGIVLDETEAVISGITNGETYYGQVVFTARDTLAGILSVEIDGVDKTHFEGQYVINPDNQEHTVVVTDKAGNKTEYKITVCEIYEITFMHPTFELGFPVNYGASFNKAHPDTVQDMVAEKDYHTFIGWYESTDGGTTLKDTPYDFNADVTDNVTLYPLFEIYTYTVTYKADGEVVGTVTVEHGKDATAPAIPEKEGYTQTAPTWDKDGKNITADTEISAVYTVNEYTVTFMDENGVYKTVTVKHGEKVTMPETPKKDGYTVKWEKVLDTVTEDTTVKAVYTEIPATDKPSSPQTGDNTQMWLWWLLLIVSGGAVITLTVYDRKRRNANSK